MRAMTDRGRIDVMVPNVESVYAGVGDTSKFNTSMLLEFGV